MHVDAAGACNIAGSFDENHIKNKQTREGSFRSRFVVSTSDDACGDRACTRGTLALVHEPIIPKIASPYA